MSKSLMLALFWTSVCNGWMSRSFSIASKAASVRNIPQRKATSSSPLFSSSSSTTSSSRPTGIRSNEKPQDHYDSIICGAGPAGLLTAIMLSQKYGNSHNIAVCERRPAIPPSPFDAEVWNDVARFYQLGIGHRGQKALKEFGVFEDFVQASVAVNGRRDWQPGMTKVEDGRITPARKDVTSRVLARDKLVGVLYHHLFHNYSKANIDLLYGYQVEPTSFGTNNQEGGEDYVTVQISKCTEEDISGTTPNSEEDETCTVDSFHVSTTKLLIGSDGSARTVANVMEALDAQRITNTNPLLRPFVAKPFKVKRYTDDNPRVYKSVPIQLPSDWPCDLNYSARSTGGITLEALPSDANGSLCALLLMKPEEELAQANVEPAKLRALFDKEFPQFSALIDDEEMERVATKSASTIPSFRYAGPRLNMGKRTLILGDAAHTVKPYYGLGANSAFEDVLYLSQALDDATVGSNGKEESIPKAVDLFSNRRSGDASALVMMSRNMDRPGKLFFACFILPIILDGVFHKMAPKLFGPNMFGMFQKDLSFQQIQRKKRLDRILQVGIIGSMLTAVGWGVKSSIRIVARATGKSQMFVSASTFVSLAVAQIIFKKVKGKKPKEERA